MPESISLTTFLIVCPAAFLAGLVDAIAGGGGLIALPGYLIAGLPAYTALGTNKFASAVGMCVSAVRLWRNGFVDLKLAPLPAAAAFAGSILGARLALGVPEAAFELILICLLPLVAALVLRKKTLRQTTDDMDLRRRIALLSVCALACGTYDGFYGPGAGTFMLASFAAVGHLGVRDASGQMRLANFASGFGAMATFAAAGTVVWPLGLAAAVFATAGHWIGAGLVIRNGVRVVRPIIVAVLLLLFTKTGWELLQ